MTRRRNDERRDAEQDIIGARVAPPPGDEFNLFNQNAAPTNPGRARLPDTAAKPQSARKSKTSAKAAREIEPNYYSQLARVRGFYKGRGREGATREEVSDSLNMRLSSVCSAVRTLYKQGWIGSNCVANCPTLCEHDVRSRKGSSGKDNEVLVYEDHVLRWNRIEQCRPATYRQDWRTNE